MTPVIDRLQKLINHERSARDIGNLAEAEAFAAKIAELLFAHKLSMSEVEAAEEERDEPVSQENVEGFTAPWAGVLAQAVCLASFCRVLRGYKHYVFIGRTTDRMAAISLYRHLSTLGISIADDELEKYRHTPEGEYEFAVTPRLSRTWKVSFLRGYANAIYRRIEADRKTLTAKAQSAGSSLIFIDKSKSAIDSFVSKEYPHLRKTYQGRGNIHGDAYRNGQRHGSNVSLKGAASLTDGR